MLLQGTSRWIGLAVVGVLGCGSNAAAKLHVLAAASLTDALPPVVATWSAGGGMPVELVFDGTSRLAAQIEAGAPADVFFSADRQWMDALDDRGRLVADSRHDVLGNRLVVVVPSGAQQVPRAPEELRAIGRLALAGEEVPAGRYARAALDSLAITGALAGRIVEGDDVRTALAWVAKGEADAAIVYATDAKVEPRVEVAFELPTTAYPPIVYPIAAIADGKHPDAAVGFVAHVRSETALAVFREAGFTALP